MAQVPVWLVAGFLGSGKTTVLRRLAAGGRRLIFVVNEFASVDVDAGRIAHDGGFSVGISGGSLFCRCLVTRFYSVLSELHARFWQSPTPADGAGRYEGIVVECSGLADPRAAVQLLRETKLDGLYRIAGVTTVVDPGTAAKLFSVLPVFRWQIECSDLVLVNKTDLFRNEQVEAAVSIVRSIRAGLKVICCSQGQVASETLLDLREKNVEPMPTPVAALATCRDSRLADGAHHFQTTVRHENLCAALSAFDEIEGLQRVKGTVNTTEGAWEVDWCLHRQSALKRFVVVGDAPEPRLVALGTPEAVETAVAQFKRLDDAANAS